MYINTLFTTSWNQNFLILFNKLILQCFSIRDLGYTHFFVHYPPGITERKVIPHRPQIIKTLFYLCLPIHENMKKKKLTITEADFLLANRRAARQEEIEAHGHPVRSGTMVHKSKKVYNRNLIKRAAIKRDDSSYFLQLVQIGGFNISF